MTNDQLTRCDVKFAERSGLWSGPSVRAQALAIVMALSSNLACSDAQADVILHAEELKTIQYLVKRSDTLPENLSSIWINLSSHGKRLLSNEPNLMTTVVTRDGMWLYRTGGQVIAGRLPEAEGLRVASDAQTMEEFRASREFEGLAPVFRIEMPARGSHSSESVQRVVARTLSNDELTNDSRFLSIFESAVAARISESEDPGAHVRLLESINPDFAVRVSQVLNRPNEQDMRPLGPKPLDRGMYAFADDTGHRVQVLQRGTGLVPSAGDQVRIHYTLSTEEGVVIDTSLNRGAPATVKLEDLPLEVRSAIQLVPVGTSVNVWIPPAGAYLEGRVPEQTMVKYEIQLLDIVDSPEGAMAQEKIKDIRHQ